MLKCKTGIVNKHQSHTTVRKGLRMRLPAKRRTGLRRLAHLNVRVVNVTGQNPV